MSSLVCEICGALIPRGTVGCWCRVCLESFCSPGCTEKHEAKHLPSGYHQPAKQQADEPKAEQRPINEHSEESPKDFDWSKALNLEYLTHYFRTHLK